MVGTRVSTLVIAGASGVVGRALTAAAAAAGRTVRLLSLREAPPGAAGPSVVRWHPEAAAAGNETALNAVVRAVDGAAAVVNLAGASIGDGSLNAAHRARVLQSRLDATTALVRAFAAAANPPAALVNASAVGYYGDRGDERLTEASAPGRGFLSDVCVRWEEAAHAARDLPNAPRLAIARLGLVLAPDADAWRRMLGPIRWGVGGALGSGLQWWSWIAAQDAAAALLRFAFDAESAGVYNVVAPAPVRQIDLTRAAARALGRPAVLPAPAFALRLALGEVADALLLPSQYVLPARLTADGFVWREPDIASFVPRLVGREPHR